MLLVKNQFVLKVSLDGITLERISKHKTARDAAKAAWDFCEECDLEMPSTEWEVDTRYGPQSCYNMMVPAGDEHWECDAVFIKFMKNRAAKGEVRLYDGDSFISITKK